MRQIVVLTVLVVMAFALTDSYALTTEQVIQLKKAGVSEKTIQLMLKQEADQRAADAYSKIGTREVTDSKGNTTVIYSTGDATVDREEQQKVDNAWKMLQNIKIEKHR
jgi:hypothetical protein